MTKLWMLRMKLNLTMLLRIMEMIGVDEDDNKPVMCAQMIFELCRTY